MTSQVGLVALILDLLVSLILIMRLLTVYLLLQTLSLGSIELAWRLRKRRTKGRNISKRTRCCSISKKYTNSPFAKVKLEMINKRKKTRRVNKKLNKKKIKKIKKPSFMSFRPNEVL